MTARGARLGRVLRRCLPLALFCSVAAAEEPPVLAELARTGDLICDLRASDAATRRTRTEMMLIVDRVSTRSLTARTISSRRAGARSVQIYAGETGVHFVEDLSGSVVVMTLLGCDARAANGRCVRYSAVNAWHFDQSVHRDVDTAFRRLPGTSYAGSCEAWRMEDPVKAELKSLP